MVVSCRGIKKATGCKPKAWVKRKIRLPAPAPLGGQTHVNNASNEEGVTKYFCNRNPRSLELLGVAPKPRGYETRRFRVDYHHRHAK